jgi:hypothetical protein
LPTSTMYRTINWLQPRRMCEGTCRSFLTCPPLCLLKALVMVDESHATGFFGPTGRGTTRTYAPLMTNVLTTMPQACPSILTSWTASMSPTPQWAYELRPTRFPSSRLVGLRFAARLLCDVESARRCHWRLHHRQEGDRRPPQAEVRSFTRTVLPGTCPSLNLSVLPRSRPYLFSNSLPPALVGATLRTFELLTYQPRLLHWKQCMIIGRLTSSFRHLKKQHFDQAEGSAGGQHRSLQAGHEEGRL